MTRHDTVAQAIDTKQVYYFMMLAKYGSISGAATALGLAQPSVSENIARLEKKLNTRLAIRSSRGVMLTEAGRFLASEGQAFIAMAETLAENLRQIGDRPQGPVAIGLPPSLSHLVSVPLAETVRLEYEGIKLHLSEALTGHILDWVARDSLDFGFVYSNPESTTFQTNAVLDEEMFLIAAPDDCPVEPDAQGNRVIQAKALADLPLVAPSMPHSARRVIESFARANGIRLNVVVDMDSLSQMIEMVSRASAYAVLPQAPVADAVASGRLVLVRIVEPTFARTVYLTRKRQRPASMASLIIQKAVLEVLAEMIRRYDIRATLTPFAQSLIRGAVADAA